MKTKVSVIVPALNEEKYLAPCLRSIVGQRTSLEYEIIVVDSGSKDRTEEVARKYADLFINTKKRGIALARNTGANNAKGQLFVFVDADTKIPPNYIDAVHAVMEEKTLAGLSCAFKFDKASRSLNAAQELSNKYLLVKGSFGKGEILGFNNAVRRETFFRAGGFPDAPLEDGAFAKKLRGIGRVIYLPEPMVTTSARRLESGGTLKAAFYYANLMLATNFPHTPLKSLLRYKKYLPIR
ncbi:Glycosyltransferase AglE [Candidatus Gugararchaeum adminiculabundum]|nr:Glycosyltransferase AglE [Candidatus Gugararchaeum adminiculabundum]